jgi:predicted phosphodiesterase
MRLVLTSDTHFGHDGKTQSKHQKFLKAVAEENPDVLVHAGDWTSSKQEQFRRTLEMFREELRCPIVAVRGNHDFWQTVDRFHFLQETESLFEQHEIWFRQFNIHHVSQGPFVIDGWTITGFDGWYGNLNPPTNDEKFMPLFTQNMRTMEWFNRKAHWDLQDILDKVDLSREKKICVTHFPPFTENQLYAQFCANQNYLEVLCERFELLLVGHSHRECDWVFKGTRIVNSGADYNAPKYKVLDL